MFMSLPDSYTHKPGAISAYFEAIKNAGAPERFTFKFLSDLGFGATNDRMFLGILKELCFIDSDGKPTDRYYKFLDKNESEKMIADGIRDAYSDLFTVNTKAYALPVDDVKNKLRALYAGKKTDQVIGRIAATFASLCEIADFSLPRNISDANETKKDNTKIEENDICKKPLGLKALEYHINIILPSTKDQSVYDAIFKSLRDHLG
jgi:hypothetical protein